MLRVGFIGLGMGRAHMKGAAAHPDAKVVACCDIVEERRKNKDGVDVAEEFEGCAFYTDYKDMIANEELDAVVRAVAQLVAAVGVKDLIVAVFFVIHDGVLGRRRFREGHAEQKLSETRRKGMHAPTA